MPTIFVDANAADALALGSRVIQCYKDYESEIEQSHNPPTMCNLSPACFAAAAPFLLTHQLSVVP